MEEELQGIVINETTEYINKKLITPVINSYLKDYDERCYSVLTEDLASIFEEYQPKYFGDYYSHIGKYFYNSLYDDYIPHDMLIEIIKADDDERFEGIKVFFDDFNAIDHTLEDTARDMTINFDYVNELLVLMILRHLNKQM